MDTKLLIAAAALAVSTVAGLGGAAAAPWEHRPAPRLRHEIHRVQDEKLRAYENLRARRYRDIGTPVLAHGHFLVRARNAKGHLVFVTLDPATGAITGEFRA